MLFLVIEIIPINNFFDEFNINELQVRMERVKIDIWLSFSKNLKFSDFLSNVYLKHQNLKSSASYKTI